MKPDTVIDTKLTRPDRSHRMTNGIVFIGIAAALMLWLWLWNQVQDVLEPVIGRVWSIRSAITGFFISIFGLGWNLAPFGNRNETEEWDEDETTK